MNVQHCESPAAMVQATCDAIVQALRDALQARAQAVLAVSGGRSPLPLFEALRAQALDWSRVAVTLVDERCVPHDHADSNTALVRQHLLQGPAAAARFVPWFDTLPAGPLNDPALDTLAREAGARVHDGAWPIDVAVLGMGEDGHTASLFPGAPGLAQALQADALVAWTRPLTAPHARLTLTLPALRAARALLLPLSGAAKRNVFEQALERADEHLPVSLLMHAPATPLRVWLA